MFRVDFNRRLKLEFHGSKITSDAGLLAYRELGDALPHRRCRGLSRASPTGKNGRRGMTGQIRQSVLGRLSCHEDVNDADRLGCDSVMRRIVGDKAVKKTGRFHYQMGRFETEDRPCAWLTPAESDLP